MAGDRRRIKGAAYQAVRRALWQSEVPLTEAELVELPVFAHYVAPYQAVARALYDLKDAHEARKRDDGTWESRDRCEDCGDDHAEYRGPWDAVLCAHCASDAAAGDEGDRAFDLSRDH